jgi:hypothetical protein
MHAAKVVIGKVERQARLVVRLTYAFSRKWEDLRAALALYFAYYNFRRVHSSSIKQTPATAAGLTNRAWDLADLLA